MLSAGLRFSVRLCGLRIYFWHFLMLVVRLSSLCLFFDFVSLVDHATSPSVPRVIFVRDVRGTHGDKVRVRLHCQVRFEPAALLFTFCGWLTTWEKTTIP